MDYYETLGLQRDATPEQIKKAYRAHAKKHHPDRNPDDPSAEGRFKKATEAYETLSDAEKRKQYDLTGSATGGLQIDLDDIFAAFRSRPLRRRGANLEASVEIGMEDVLRGARRSVRVIGPVPCGPCRGTGTGDAAHSRPCNCCGGCGRMETTTVMGRMVSECPACKGSGRHDYRGCAACSGSGSVASARTLEMSVPPGVPHGAVVRMRGHGGAGQLGGPPGDLHVRVSVRPHPLFSRRGDDLWQGTAISFSAASLGGSVDVHTLDGEMVLTIPPGTQSGQTFRLTGKGLPKLRSNVRGDMLVHVSVAVPTDLTDEQRDIIRSLRKSLEVDGGCKLCGDPAEVGDGDLCDSCDEDLRE